MPRPTVLKGPFLLDQEAGHYRIRCPGCGTEGTIDFEQYTGRVSIQCPTEGCGYHEDPRPVQGGSMTIRERWWAWKDRRRRRQIEEGALAAGRFVLYISLYGRRTPICFVPREEEAELFFRQYVVPWTFGSGGIFSHQGPWVSPGGPVYHEAPRIEVLRHRDVLAVEIIAPDRGYRDRLDVIMAGCMAAERARQEGERLAEQAAHFTRAVQATVDAHRTLERGGGQDPKGSG